MNNETISKIVLLTINETVDILLDWMEKKDDSKNVRSVAMFLSTVSIEASQEIVKAFPTQLKHHVIKEIVKLVEFRDYKIEEVIHSYIRLIANKLDIVCKSDEALLEKVREHPKIRLKILF